MIKTLLKFGTVAKFRLWYQVNLSELINFYTPFTLSENLIISGGLEVKQFAKMRLILELKFGEDPLNVTLLAQQRVWMV